MIKKCDLRSEFERIVTTKKRVFDWFPSESESIKTFSLEIFSLGRTFLIALYGIGVTGKRECLAKSFPFRSYKSAYQTLVRL